MLKLSVSMVTLRRLAIFIFSTLLTGSAAYSAAAVGTTPKCPPPGAVQPPDTKCYYVLTIIKVGDGGRVTGKVAQSALEKNKKDNPDFPIEQYPHSQFEFHVKDSTKLT